MMWWEILLIIIGLLLLILGIIGAVAPIIPGPPLSWLALLCLEFTAKYNINIWILIITGVFMALITILDYWFPVAGAKYFGGSKTGLWGSAIGVVVALIFFPIIGFFGIIIFPFIGAFIGELMAKKTVDISLKAAFGTLLGFLAGTAMKLLYSIVILLLYVILLFV